MFRPNKKFVIAFGIGILAVGSMVVVRQQYLLPIVTYHSVKPKVPEGNGLTVSVRTFDRQMAFLKRHHYNVVPLEAVPAYIVGAQKVPARTLSITFDDGYEDNYTYAFPILKKYGIPATVFVIVEDIGKPGWLSWDEILEMQRSGLVSFGSHTLTHPFLAASSPEVQRKEIYDSKKLLEERLGVAVNSFAYPMGNFDARVRQTVHDAGYRVAVGTHPGRKYSNRDVLLLKRLRISENAGNMFVFWFETSGYYSFIKEHRHK